MLSQSIRYTCFSHVKGKAIGVEASTGSLSSRSMRLPDLQSAH